MLARLLILNATTVFAYFALLWLNRRFRPSPEIAIVATWFAASAVYLLGVALYR